MAASYKEIYSFKNLGLPLASQKRHILGLYACCGEFSFNIHIN